MSNDIRAALERLVRAYDSNEGLPIAEWIATARAALAEPVGEGPSDEDIHALHQAVFASRLYAPPPRTTAEADFARAILARWGHPAAPPAPQSGLPWKTDGPAVPESREPASVAPDARPTPLIQAAQAAPSRVLVHCPETCWIEIRRIADGKIIYSNHRKGTLMLPIGEPPAEPPAPAGGLAERLAGVWNYGQPLHPAAARAAIREVAAWLDERGMHGCSVWLREEADRCP